MEILVGALVVLGFLAILARFGMRDATGEIRLPRVVDDSIGMWTLRRITGRRLGERAWDDEPDGDMQLDPNAADPTRAALGAIAAANATSSVSTSRPAFAPAPSSTAPSGPAPSAPPLSAAAVTAPARTGTAPTAAARIARPAYVAQRRRTKGRPVRASSMMSPTPVLDMRRRQEASARRRPSPWPRRIAALAAVAAVIVVAAVAIVGLGALQSSAPRGQVLAATGRPQLSAPASALAIAGGGAAPSDEPGNATEPSDAAHTTALPPAPHARFSFDVSEAVVTFTNTSTGTDPSWFWNFHDGSTSLAMSPVHEFLATGTYVVELTITDASGRTDSDSRAVTIP